MKKCAASGLILFCCLLSSDFVFGAGGTVDTNLQMLLPYVEYQGNRFQLTLDFYQNPLDPSGLYWKYNSVALTALAEQQGGTVDQALNISDVTVMYGGQQLNLNLTPYANANDPSGFYWKLTGYQAVPGTIGSVSGSSYECYDFDPAQLMSVVDCITNCGEDVECLLNCYGDLGIGGAFNLALQFDNPTSGDLEFKIPPGTVFIPADNSFQSMMVLHEPPFTLAPGTSTVCVTTYCLNSGLSAPGDQDVYNQGGIAALPCLQEIINLTYGKSLDTSEIGQIQNIIWECTDTGSISQASRVYLQGL
jgi:hypothetical protein